MRIVKPSALAKDLEREIPSPISSKEESFNIYDVPFVPCEELWSAKNKKLSLEEAAAVASALYILLPEEDSNSIFLTNGRLEGVSQRI